MENNIFANQFGILEWTWNTLDELYGAISGCFVYFSVVFNVSTQVPSDSVVWEEGATLFC